MTFTVQVSGHPKALEHPAPQAAVDSWQTVYHGNTTTAEARFMAECVKDKAVRVFRGQNIGRLVYEKAAP